MPQFTKRPVVVEAIRWENNTESLDAIHAICPFWFAADGTPDLLLETLNGVMRAAVGDWIVRDEQGLFYPCKPDVFEATYEPSAPAKEPDSNG